MPGITTHVLDTAKGRPASGVPVTLLFEGRIVSRMTTDENGRANVLPTDTLFTGMYRLIFDTATYDPSSFFPEIAVFFNVADGSQSYHVPLLLSPFGYSTYRGS